MNTVLRDSEQVVVTSKKLVEVFWEVCERFPDELICWIDDYLNLEVSSEFQKVFHHDLIMASFPVQSDYIPIEIGYIDQLPFINPDYSVKYPTWRMSTDIGGVSAKVVIQFKALLEDIKDLGYLLNSIAKIGQQNSLFCYTALELVKTKPLQTLLNSKANKRLFDFVSQHYKKARLFLLLLCFIKYERKLPIWLFFKALFKKSFFKEHVELSSKDIRSSHQKENNESIDVIIPTMKRTEYLRNVLNDLAGQTHRPKQVIIVEQDPDLNSKTKLDFIGSNHWPFRIVHHFVHKTGACHARDLALKNVESNYIFFADDDLRFSEDLLQRALEEINRLGVGCLNLNCILPEGKTIFPKIKQWGAFGSGTSVVRSKFALQCEFSELFEHGFGEDIDFGMQLRSKGCDIIYHPDITTIHLKAQEGGFRTVSKDKWKRGAMEPKPSPTMMILVKKYYNRWMRDGYKIELFLRFYGKQSVKNPLAYIKRMNEKWQLSSKMAEELLNSRSK